MQMQQFLRKIRVSLLLFLIVNLQINESVAEIRKSSSVDKSFDVFSHDDAEFDRAQSEAKLIPEPEAARAAIVSIDNAFVSSETLPLSEDVVD